MRTKLLLLGITTLILASCGGGSSSTAGPGTDLAVQTTQVRAHVNTTATGVINLKAVDGNVTLSSLTINGADSGLFKINQTDLASCQKAPITKGKACNVRYTFTPTSATQTKFTATAVANGDDNDPINATLLTGADSKQIAVLGTQPKTTTGGQKLTAKVYWQVVGSGMTATVGTTGTKNWVDVTPAQFTSSTVVNNVVIGRNVTTKKLTVIVTTGSNLYVQSGISASNPSLSKTGWTQVSLASVDELTFDPIHPGVVYAAIKQAIYQSTDNGLTWSNTGFDIPGGHRADSLLAASASNGALASRLFTSAHLNGQSNQGQVYLNINTGSSGLTGAWNTSALTPTTYTGGLLMPVFDVPADSSNSFPGSFFLFGELGPNEDVPVVANSPIAYLYNPSASGFTKLNLDLPATTRAVDGLQMLPAATPPGSGAPFACNLAVASLQLSANGANPTTILQYYDIDQGGWSNITPNPAQEIYLFLYATSDGDDTGSDNHLFTVSASQLHVDRGVGHVLTVEQSPFTGLSAWTNITPGGDVALNPGTFAVSRPYYNQCDTN